MSECNSIECNVIEKIYCQRNRGMILNKAKNYYVNEKKKIKRASKR